MAENKNPESLKELNAFKITDELKSFVTDLSYEIQTEKTNRSFWETNQNRYFNIRYGIRQLRNFPWPNAANYMLPLIDIHINNALPAYISLINANPICNFEPFGGEDVEPSRKRELLFDWRMRTQVKFFEPYALGVNKLLSAGAVVFKTIWKFRSSKYVEELDLEDLSSDMLSALYDVRVTDELLEKIIIEEIKIDTDYEENIEEVRKAVKDFRAGKTSFKFNLFETVEDRAQVVPRDLKEDITIPIDTLVFEDNLDNARFIDDTFTVSKNEIKRDIKDGKYEQYADEVIDSWKDNFKNSKTTGQTLSDDMVLLHETCVWYDYNDDGIQERCIVTWPDSDPNSILRFIENPYDHGQWPYSLIKRELNDPSPYSSRGIPALDEDFQNGISEAFNQAINNGTIVNTPVVIAKRGTVTNVKNRRYIPGEYVETTGATTDYEIRQNVNLSQGTLFQQAQFLKSFADQRMGNTTSGISDQTNLPGQGQGGNKTKAEIDLLAGLENKVTNMDLIVFQAQMARVYYQIDALYMQFGPETNEIYITGEEPMRFSRKEIQGKFNIIPNGKLDNSNPLQRAQKAFNLKQMFTGNPAIKEYELDKIILNDYDARISSRILKTPQEMAQEQAQAMAQQEAMRKQLFGEQLMMQEQELKNKIASDVSDVKKQHALSILKGGINEN